MKQIFRMMSLSIMLSLNGDAYAKQHFDKLWSLLTVNTNHGRWHYYVEPQLRLVDQDKVFQQFLNNVGLGYEFVPEWQFWLGETTSMDSQDAVPGDQDEIRLWEQLLWTHSVNDVTVISRTRLENRYSLNFPPWAYRLRERIIFKKAINSRLSWMVYDEIFYNLNKVPWIITSQFDQNRSFIGLEQRLLPQLFFSAGYLNQYLSTANPQINHVVVLWFRVNLES